MTHDSPGAEVHRYHEDEHEPWVWLCGCGTGGSGEATLRDAVAALTAHLDGEEET